MKTRLGLRLIVVLFLFTVIVAGVPPRQAKWASLGGDYRRSGLSQDPGPTGGCVQWQFETTAAISGSATVGFDGRVHIACEDGRLYTLDAGGRASWVFDANTPLVSAASIALDGNLYVGGRNGRRAERAQPRGRGERRLVFEPVDSRRRVYGEFGHQVRGRRLRPRSGGRRGHRGEPGSGNRRRERQPIDCARPGQPRGWS